MFDSGGYVQFSAEGLAAGHGMYTMAADQIDRYRRAVADDRTGEELQKIIVEVESHDIGVQGREKLKTAPRGYPKDHARVDLLRNKGLVAWKQWPVEAWLGTPAAKAHVVDFLRATQPLYDWLTRNVGPSATA